MLEELIYSVKLTILSSYSVGNQHNTFHKKGVGKLSVTETAWFPLMTSLCPCSLALLLFGSDTPAAVTLPGNAAAAAWKCFVRFCACARECFNQHSSLGGFLFTSARQLHCWVWACQMFCTDKTQLQHQSWQEKGWRTVIAKVSDSLGQELKAS